MNIRGMVDENQIVGCLYYRFITNLWLTPQLSSFVVFLFFFLMDWKLQKEKEIEKKKNMWSQ